MPRKSCSHQLVVNAYLLRAEKFLLLKRTHPPRIWVPPGGHLKPDEDPIQGLLREIREETALEAAVIAPINTWFGKWENQWLLAIDYLAYYQKGELKLSSEHSAGTWVSIAELRNGRPVKLRYSAGFQVADFEKAWQLGKYFQKIRKKKDAF